MELETLAEIKLATRAFNDGWNVPIDVRKAVIERAAIRAQCGDPEIEDQAGKLLLAIDKFNHSVSESEQKRLEAEHARKLQLIELAVRIGAVQPFGGTVGITGTQSPES